MEVFFQHILLIKLVGKYSRDLPVSFHVGQPLEDADVHGLGWGNDNLERLAIAKRSLIQPHSHVETWIRLAGSNTYVHFQGNMTLSLIADPRKCSHLLVAGSLDKPVNRAPRKAVQRTLGIVLHFRADHIVLGGYFFSGHRF